jgi:hypothetical protein
MNFALHLSYQGEQILRWGKSRRPVGNGSWVAWQDGEDDLHISETVHVDRGFRRPVLVHVFSFLSTLCCRVRDTEYSLLSFTIWFEAFVHKLT